MKSPAERSMGTATATTVSTVVSDYTMESDGMRKGKKIARTNDDAGRDNKNTSGTEPVVWYAFYSEKVGREYYYEPKSRTAMWVMPDDYHPHPNNQEVTDETAGADQPELMPAPKVKRKVSWVSAKSEASSLEKKEGALSSDRKISDSTVEKTMGKRLLAGTACLVVLGGAFCLGRFSDTGPNAGSAPFVSMPSIVPEDHQRAAEVLVPVESVAELENDETGYEMKVEEDQSTSGRIDVPAKIEAETSERAPEEMHRENDEKEEKEKDPPPPPAPAKCKIPFAYIVSGECRRRELPLFDAEAFSLLMMQ
mmetsp:Transcript_10752/g.30237  ORF Transcript_10752/g.30237 Transcript_10752/m.30237 type:complete len:309 (+) Transcript_10752:67-993(+)